jgi:hypothetical protein
VSTNPSAARACSPVADGVGLGVGDGDGLGEGVGLGVGVGAAGVGEGSGLRDGPDRRRRVELDVLDVAFSIDEEDCALAAAAILAVASVGVAFGTTLQPTAASVRAIAIGK